MKFLDLTFNQLMLDAPKVILEGLSGTKTMVVPDPSDAQKGFIIRKNSRGEILGCWPIRAGRAYRITTKVIALPLIENDPNPIRRFCRKNGLPLTMIVRIDRGEQVYFGPALYQGDSNFRSLKEDEPPVALKSLKTTEANPSWVEKILVVKGEEPKTYEEFCAIAQNWQDVKDGRYVL